MENRGKIEEEMKPAISLKRVKFPLCAKTCMAAESFGVSECDSICPEKFQRADFSNVEVYEWLEDKKYQVDREGEHEKLFLVDMPKVFRDFEREFRKWREETKRGKRNTKQEKLPEAEDDRA